MLKVILAYKNFAANKHISHIGLGVSAMNTSKVLRKHGIAAEVWPIVHAHDLADRLAVQPASHVIVSAPWIPSAEFQRLSTLFSTTQFAVNCHSNVGFLQADSQGVRLVREAMELEMGLFNFHLAGNSRRFCKWIRSAYAGPCAYLPNLYHLKQPARCFRPVHSGGTLRVGAFGATRPLKNFMSAAGAALEIARSLKVNLEFWISAGRNEGGHGTFRAVHAMLDGVPGVTLVENGWQCWPKFRQTVAHMHLLLQPSYTESFNMITADGIAEGVPSVVSEAIDWAPRHWKAMTDDVGDIARIGRHLLSDTHAAHDGYEALQHHNCEGLKAWMDYLN